MPAILSLLLSWRPEVETSAAGNSFYVQSPTQTYTFKGWSGGMLKAADALKEGAGEESLSDLAAAEDGLEGLASFYYFLRRFNKLGLLSFTLLNGSEAWAVYVPDGTGPAFPAPDLDRQYAVSRFAYTRREGDGYILESPLANGYLILKHWQAAAVISLLSVSASPREILEQIPGVSDSVLQSFLGLLLEAGILRETDSSGLFPEEAGQTLRQWEFHDLLFHARTRMKASHTPYGGTCRFQGKIPPQPVSKAPMSGEVISLYKPDMDRLKAEDYPFTLVLEERRSVREYADDPITLEALGEFLYRTLRIKAAYEENPAIGHLYGTSLRPYPGGGACYELEVYLAVSRCEGLAAGLYHYAPERHELERLSGLTGEVESLLRDSAGVAGLKDFPPVSIHLAARFQRVAWKYQSMAYSVILKNVGALYQTMYLVATAMDLAPSALGGGHAELLCEAAGLNYLEESPVGEFILGRKRS